jgi:predicted nucleic acid-binding protein
MPVFLDTNIWVYAFLDQDMFKQGAAKQLIEREEIIVSHQLLGELTNVLLRAQQSPDIVAKTIGALCQRYPIIKREAKDYTHSIERRSRYNLSFLG